MSARDPLEPRRNEDMWALRAHTRGGPEGLVHERAPIPEPGIGDVLVQVHAASFTPTELAWPSTWVDRAGRDRRPVIPAHEVCGTVVGLGSGTTGFQEGDVVYGLTDWYRDGAAAEYVAVEGRNLGPQPESLDEVEAAATAMPALTAWQALFTHGQLAPGHTVLVLGAGGGVGSFAVQLARWAGARVIAYARATARDTVLGLEADEFIESLEARAGSVDLVFDLIGGEALGWAWSQVRAGGAVVSVVEEPDARPERRGEVRSAYFIVEPSGALLRELAGQIEAREMHPIVGDVRSLAEGAVAFTAKQSGGIRGKSVLQVAP